MCAPHTSRSPSGTATPSAAALIAPGPGPLERPEVAAQGHGGPSPRPGPLPGGGGGAARLIRPRSPRRATAGRSERASRVSPTPAPGGPTPMPPCAGGRCAPRSAPRSRRPRPSGSPLAMPASPAPLGRPPQALGPALLREALKTKVLPELGRLRLSSVDRVAIQDHGRPPGRPGPRSVHRAQSHPSLRAIFRCEVARSGVVQNPTHGLSLPAVRGRRDRVARPEEARALIAAVPAGDPALWAPALYAGRRGELQALSANRDTSPE